MISHKVFLSAASSILFYVWACHITRHCIQSDQWLLITELYNSNACPPRNDLYCSRYCIIAYIVMITQPFASSLLDTPNYYILTFHPQVFTCYHIGLCLINTEAKHRKTQQGIHVFLHLMQNENTYNATLI